MNNLVEYKATISSGQAKMSSLSDELLDHEKELQAATNKVEELVSMLYNVLWNFVWTSSNERCAVFFH